MADQDNSNTEYSHPSGEITLTLDLDDPEEREACIWVKANNETDARALLDKHIGWLNECLNDHDLNMFDASENNAEVSDDPTDPGFIFLIEFPPADD